MNKKILLVDDVKLFLRLEETFFKRTGCEIIMAQSGEEAIKAAVDYRPELILLDFIMPDMMGDEVVTALKSDARTKTIPIMIVSTSADQKDIDKCFSAGADDYVTKPINPQEVLSKAAALLDIPQRLHYRVPVTLKIEGEADDRSFISFSRNISQGGILVECKENIGKDTVVNLELPIKPNAGRLSLKGKVVRVEEENQAYFLGIMFVGLMPTDEKAISEFLKQYEPPR